MKAYEIPARISSAGALEIPADFLKRLPTNQLLKLIVLVDETSDDEDNLDWSRLTQKQFLANYDEADAIYDGV